MSKIYEYFILFFITIVCTALNSLDFGNYQKSGVKMVVFIRDGQVIDFSLKSSRNHFLENLKSSQVKSSHALKFSSHNQVESKSSDLWLDLTWFKSKRNLSCTSLVFINGFLIGRLLIRDAIMLRTLYFGSRSRRRRNYDHPGRISTVVNGRE